MVGGLLPLQTVSRALQIHVSKYSAWHLLIIPTTYDAILSYRYRYMASRSWTVLGKIYVSKAATWYCLEMNEVPRERPKCLVLTSTGMLKCLSALIKKTRSGAIQVRVLLHPR